MSNNANKIKTIWIPNFSCIDDVTINLCLQDFVDKAFFDRSLAIDYLFEIKEAYKDVWNDFTEINDEYNGFEECGWEFIWTYENKKYSCSMTIKEIPIIKK